MLLLVSVWLFADDDGVYHAGDADYPFPFLSAFPPLHVSSAAVSVAPSLGPASCGEAEALFSPAPVSPPLSVISSPHLESHCLSVLPALEALDSALWLVGTCSRLSDWAPQ